MNTTRHRRILIALALPFALGLAACGETAEEGATTSGEPIETIAAPEGGSWLDVAAVTPEGGHVVGNPDAPIKLVEYASHTCPACANFANQAGSGIDEYVETGVVSFELRNQVHDALDLTIAMLARCGEPSAFQPLAKQGWANLDQIVGGAQSAGEALGQAMQAPPEQRYQAIAETSGLLDFFAARGISRDQAMQCLSDPAQAEAIVEASTTQSDELGVTGTPTFFLNGNRIDDTSWAGVEAALQAAGAR